MFSQVNMMFDIHEESGRYAEEIKALRRKIHRYPELGNNEWHTAALIEKYLNKHGISTERYLDTAVVGRLYGAKNGKTVAVRADMDALPVTETAVSDFRSEITGVMHACGHDVHTAALLGAAAILADHRDEIGGNVVFIFQPDEEGRGGALRLINEGVLNDVDAITGAHVSPDIPEGHIGIRYRKFYSASDMFTVKVTGKSSHGAMREKGIDALGAAAGMVTELLALPSKVTQERCVLTVGRMESGTAGNIMPGYAEFEGIIRSLGEDTRKAMEEGFREAVSAAAERTGTTAEIIYSHSYPGIVNDIEMTAMSERAAEEFAGREKVHIISEPVMMTEDFGYYQQIVPGTFFHIGAGCELPLHNSRFLPSEGVACVLAGMHVELVMTFLSDIIQM